MWLYCYIQKIQNKKNDEYGECKELELTQYTCTTNGVTKTKYGYRESDERFERPVRDVYKVSIQKSYRENGKVRKKQWHILSISHYGFIDSWYGDYLNYSVINPKLEEMGITSKELDEILDEKLNPIGDRITEEFKLTEEYKAKMKHEQTKKDYWKQKDAFESVYGRGTYDHCYNLYGELVNEEQWLDIKRQHKQKREAEERQQKVWEEQFKNTKSNSCGSSYSSTTSVSYNGDEKKKLKLIYRAASKKFHPDVYEDDGGMMKFLTKLKEQWGI